MSKLTGAIHTVKTLEDHALKKSVIHRLNPVSKLAVTLAYIGIAVSFGRYDISALLPMIFYPVVIFSLSEVDLRFFIKPLLFAMPVIVFLGIFNPVFDTQILFIGSVAVSRGWLTFMSVFIKGMLTVSAALLLAATTGISSIAAALRFIKIPKLFVLQILLVYRYITVILEEADRITLAYSLKAPGQRGIHYKVWGSLTGQLLLRTFDRAQRIYEAMLLRGFSGEYMTGKAIRFTAADCFYIILWLAFFILVRRVNITGMLGGLVVI